MITENLSTLKIHKLTQSQYERELAAGNIDEGALYLTPDITVDSINGKTGDVTLTASDVGAATSSHTHGVNTGGIGRTTLTSGYYLAGNGTSPVMMKSPVQVLTDIGALGNSGNQTLTNGSFQIVDPNNSGYHIGITRTADSKNYEIAIAPTASVGNFYYYQNGTLVNALQLYPTYTSFKQPVSVTAGGTGANNADDALANLGGIKIVKLWENASPTSSFAAQTVSLNLSGYDGVFVTAKFQTNGTDVKASTGFIAKGLKGCILVTNGTTDSLRYRSFDVSETGVVFSAGKQISNSNETTGAAIPVYIYGVKGVS